MPITDLTTIKQFALAHASDVDCLQDDLLAYKAAVGTADEANAELKLLDTMNTVRTKGESFSCEPPTSSVPHHAANPQGTANEDVSKKFNARFTPAKLGDGTLLAILQKLLSSVGGLSGLISIIMGLITGLGGGITPPVTPPTT